MMSIADNYAKVQENIELVCQKAMRKRDEITLLAVSKYHSADSVAKLALLGQKDFAENYLKEAKEKRKELEEILDKNIYDSLSWHSIGHIQTNKAKDACDNYSYLHTIDSEKLLLAINKVLEKKSIKQKILIEVNIADESQKAGVSPENCSKLVEKILSLDNFLLKGFMCLPPFQRKEGENRKYFSKMYELKNAIEKEFSLTLPHLSMGTSSDYEEAIYEGATFLRIGTDLFGEREY